MPQEIPEFRSYTHDKCGEATVIDGGHFSAISNPFNEGQKTICVHCDDAFPLTDYTWDDTGERISDAHARQRAQAPAWAQSLLSDASCLTTSVLGIVVGVAFGLGLNRAVGGGTISGWIAGVLGTIVGLIGGMMFFGGVVTPYIMSRYYHVEDWRQLK